MRRLAITMAAAVLLTACATDIKDIKSDDPRVQSYAIGERWSGIQLILLGALPAVPLDIREIALPIEGEGSRAAVTCLAAARAGSGMCGTALLFTGARMVALVAAYAAQPGQRALMAVTDAPEDDRVTMAETLAKRAQDAAQAGDVPGATAGLDAAVAVLQPRPEAAVGPVEPAPFAPSDADLGALIGIIQATSVQIQAVAPSL